MKKPYRKPELIRVSLRPEEAVLTGCKLATGSPNPGSSNHCTLPTACLLPVS